MKEAFWGVLIIILGLFGIVIINIFQKSTVDNDRVYYLIKETSEAAAYDSIDLTYYRLNGDIRIVEDKFIENLTRRFAQNVTIGDYKIIVEDINEVPPKISLRVISQITSLQGENFNLKNRVDAVVEVKYKLEEVLDFLDITKEEWEERTNINIGIEGTEKVCEITIPEDTTECLSGDIKFSGFIGDKVEEKVCKGEQKKATKKAIYKVCECGKWKEYEKEIIAEPKEVGNEYVYTWEFKEKRELREIDEQLVERTKMDACTTGIEIWVPKPDEVDPEPSEDNSKYEICGKEGIKIILGKTKVLHPNYIPSNATNRNVTWSTSDETIVSIKSSNPNNNTGYSRATITANKLGTIIITAETTLKQKATCKVEVIKDTIDSIGCSVSPSRISIGSTGVIIIPTYTPSNATNYNFEYSLSANSSVATISGNTITAGFNGGFGSVTIKDTVTGKTGTCSFDVYEPYEPDPGPSCTYFSCELCKASTGKSCQMVNGCCEPVSSSGGGSGGSSKPSKPASSGGSGGCFQKDMKVLTKKGYKNISEIKVNDEVLSYNEKTKQNEYKKVLKVYVHKNEKEVLYSLTINNKTIKVTSLHKIYIKTSNGFETVFVRNLKKGDIVMDKDGKTYPITKIVRTIKTNTYYNLEVENNHNYYVTKDNILVHNGGNNCNSKTSTTACTYP